MAAFDHALDLFLLEQEIEALLDERNKLKSRNREIARKLKAARMQYARLLALKGGGYLHK